jgi:ABC-type nitrate/sulfonate/bicarbonate transport system substrate-binding protein
MRRRTVISTLALTSLATLDRRPAWAQAAPDRIQVVGPAGESQTNLFYALKTGMFGKAGLDVVIIPSSSGAAATAAVLTGTYDLGITNLLPIFAGHLRGYRS